MNIKSGREEGWTTMECRDRDIPVERIVPYGPEVSVRMRDRDVPKMLVDYL